MEWDGAWTLVMRAKGGDHGEWSTAGFINAHLVPDPNLMNSYKVPDTVINLLKESVYRVKIDFYDKVRFFKGSCVYNHLGGIDYDCKTSYSDMNWNDPVSTTQPSYNGLTDAIYLITSFGDGKQWVIRNGINSWIYQYKADSSFTVWVR